MATIYVGPTAAGLADGTSWANRYGTLNAAEDRPIVAGDTVYVGPGVYRELLTVDVSGGAGNVITYIGDVTGENTDGIGGIVRITGSDNDQTFVRANCIYAAAKNYRTFRGFQLDSVSSHMIRVITSSTGWVIEDSAFDPGNQNLWCVAFEDTVDDFIVRRCAFMSSAAPGGIGVVVLDNNSAINSLVENCLFVGQAGVYSYGSGLAVTNCTFMFISNIAIYANTPAGETITVTNCTFTHSKTALQAAVLGELTEDYNNLYANQTDRNNVNVGGNSVAYLPLPEMPLIYDGLKLPWNFLHLSEWSQIAGITDSGTGSTDDFYGITRPVTNGKRSYGAVQYRPTERDTATTYDASDASLSLPDAGVVQFKVPVSAVSTTISVQVYREANYAGVNPQMIVKQPGQADDTTTDAGAAGGWNELTTTLTPAADPEWVMVELRSNNTAAAGNYAVYFDQLTPTPTGVLGDFDHWVSNRETVGDAIQQSGGGGAARGIIIRG